MGRLQGTAKPSVGAITLNLTLVFIENVFQSFNLVCFKRHGNNSVDMSGKLQVYKSFSKHTSSEGFDVSLVLDMLGGALGTFLSLVVGITLLWIMWKASSRTFKDERLMCLDRSGVVWRSLPLASGGSLQRFIRIGSGRWGKDMDYHWRDMG
ncbi:hypothetical protein Tco_1055028 [Tanacetum coccineum]|uniref:Uncharacterized protein n=1 Tax=Tanacetum coccineum TaxID=301880 RepID=A0ABQ5GYG3_9ASTR